MPNNITNIVRFEGDKVKISELLKSIQNDEYGYGSVDFNKIIPMPDTVTDKISSSAVFENGAKGNLGTWIVENLPENNVVMQCEIYDCEKLLIKSVPIYPDQHIERIELLESVEAGSHDVTAYINYFTLDTKEYISKVGYKINLTINN